MFGMVRLDDQCRKAGRLGDGWTEVAQITGSGTVNRRQVLR